VAGARSAADLAGSRGLSSQQLRALNKALKGIKARPPGARGGRTRRPRGADALRRARARRLTGPPANDRPIARATNSALAPIDAPCPHNRPMIARRLPRQTLKALVAAKNMPPPSKIPATPTRRIRSASDRGGA